MRNMFSVLLIFLFALAACNDNAASADHSKSDSTTSASSTANDCLEGKWSMTENGTTRAFVFNADKSGKEEYTATDIRPFTWSKKDDKTVHIVYKAQGDVQSAEYDLTINCEQKVLSYYGARYTK